MAEILTKEKILSLLLLEEQEFRIDDFRRKHGIAPESSTLYVTFDRLCKDKVLKRLGRGHYKKIHKIKPVEWWTADESIYCNFKFPYSHEDGSRFGFAEFLKFSPGDLIVLAGVSNSGKSCLALNMLAENLDFPGGCLLMGNEYATLEGKPSSKFKRRMMNVTNINWMNGNGKSKFDLLPVQTGYEEYVEPGKLNIVDWILQRDNFFEISGIMQDIKSSIGNGMAVVVIQKNVGAMFGRGGNLSREVVDAYFIIDPLDQYTSRITVDKVKESTRWVTGQTWSFQIIDGGANLLDIHEIKKCRKCWGKGEWSGGKCSPCQGKGWIPTEEGCYEPGIKRGYTGVP